MNLKELIIIEEVCTRYRVERTFIQSLDENGLIEIVRLDQKEYLPTDKIGEFEKMHRLYHDLDINVEGLQAIQHLLKQVKQLQRANWKLKNRLSLYEGG